MLACSCSASPARGLASGRPDRPRPVRAVEALLRTGRALLTQHAPGAPQKFGFHYPPFNRCGRPRRRSPAPARRAGLTTPSLRPPLHRTPPTLRTANRLHLRTRPALRSLASSRPQLHRTPRAPRSVNHLHLHCFGLPHKWWGRGAYLESEPPQLGFVTAEQLLRCLRAAPPAGAGAPASGVEPAGR